MGLVAEFDIDCEALPLVTVANAAPEATLTFEFQYNHGRRPLFLVTASGGSKHAIETGFTDAYDVAEWTLVGRAGDTRRYQLRPALSMAEQLGDHLDDLTGLEALATADAIIERIEVRRDGWTQTGWFADRDAFEQFSSFWLRNGGFRLHRLTRDGEPEPPGDGLTDRQQEAPPDGLRTGVLRDSAGGIAGRRGHGTRHLGVVGVGTPPARTDATHPGDDGDDVAATSRQRLTVVVPFGTPSASVTA